MEQTEPITPPEPETDLTPAEPEDPAEQPEAPPDQQSAEDPPAEDPPTGNPLPESSTDLQDAADRPPVHKPTAVDALLTLRQEIIEKRNAALISTDLAEQGLAAIKTIMDVLDLVT